MKYDRKSKRGRGWKAAGEMGRKNADTCNICTERKRITWKMLFAETCKRSKKLNGIKYDTDLSAKK